jgi:hypothetical protein
MKGISDILSIEYHQYSLVWILGIFRIIGGSIADLTQYSIHG